MYNSGKENIKGYYGNWFIRLNTKYSGIGIHGTHEPERIGERSTEGSIRLDNYHLDSLRAMIDVGMAVRIESSRLDREADGKPLIEQSEPAIVAETPITKESATPVIEEHHETVVEPTITETTEVTPVAVESKTETESAIEQPKQKTETQSESSAEAEEWYTIKEGDLVGRVAARYGMSLAEIKRLNPNINVDRVSIGQKIRVKGKPKAEDNTAKKATPQPTEEGDAVWHTVASGDLVGRIAAKYGTTVHRIQELNPGLNPDRISIGQKIRVK
jgi:LysM repeat protein